MEEEEAEEEGAMRATAEVRGEEAAAPGATSTGAIAAEVSGSRHRGQRRELVLDARHHAASSAATGSGTAGGVVDDILDTGMRDTADVARAGDGHTTFTTQ